VFHTATDLGMEEYLVAAYSPGEGDQVEDEVRILSVVKIESNNTSGYEAPDRSEEEDEFEGVTGDATLPGKIAVVNDGDIDGDGTQ